MNRKRTTLLLIVGWVLSTGASQVFSQGAVLEEITVTARKRAENMQDVPVAVTAFTGEQLELNTVDQLADIGALTPGLSLSTGVGHPTTANVAIRGQSEVESQLVLDPAVGIYVDGVYLGRSQALGINLFDLEQVEVLKGPQGTLFGRNTTGGAINITSADPGDSFGAYVKGTFGNYERINFQGAVSIPLAENMGVRFAANIQDRDGYVTNELPGVPGKFHEEDAESYRAKLVWTPENWEFRINFDYSESDTTPMATQPTFQTPCDPTRGFGIQVAFSPACATAFGGLFAPFNIPGGFAGTPNLAAGTEAGATYPTLAEAAAYNAAVQDDPYTSYLDYVGLATLEDWGGSISITRDFEIFQIKSITGYRELENRRYYDADATPFPVLNVDGTMDQEAVSQEVQILGDFFDGSLSYVAGFYYFREEGTDVVGIDIANTFVVTGGLLAQSLINDAVNESLAAFGQINYSPPALENLTATLGYRRTKDKRDITVRHQDLSVVGDPVVPTGCGLEAPLISTYGTPGVCAATLKQTFYGTSLLAGVDYKLTDDKLVYFTYREGFRSGAFSGRAGSLDRLRPVAPEELVDYEIGFKGDWQFGGIPVRTNAAVFFTDIDNRQRSFTRTTASGGLTTIVESAEKGEVDGWEVELLVLLAENLTVNASVSNADAKHSRFIDSEGVDRSGEPVPQSPEYSYQAGFTYKREVPAGGDVILSFSYNWLDSQSFGFNPHPTTTSGSYDLVNVRAGWTNILNTGFDVVAWGKNLGDSEYVTGGVFLFDNAGLSTNQQSEPRTYGVDIKYQF